MMGLSKFSRSRLLTQTGRCFDRLTMSGKGSEYRLTLTEKSTMRSKQNEGAVLRRPLFSIDQHPPSPAGNRTGCAGGWLFVADQGFDLFDHL